MSKLKIANLGFPRIGKERELKKSLEKFWAGKINEDELNTTAAKLRKQHWQAQIDAGADIIPVNDFSFYDQVLDTACLLGAIPQRYKQDGKQIDSELYFRLARGTGKGTCCNNSKENTALEMTKWFDTNYHYLVPEFDEQTEFSLSSEKIFTEFAEAKLLGLEARPVLLGPLTFLYLGKWQGEDQSLRFDLLEKLLPVYVQILQKLQEQGADWVQIDEPIFNLELDAAQLQQLRETYVQLKAQVPGIKILVAQYFDKLGENAQSFFDLPVDGWHVDLVRGDISDVLKNLPKKGLLSLGLVSGRDIWRSRLKSLQGLAQAFLDRGLEIQLAPSCSLLHLPFSLDGEQQLDAKLKKNLSFACEKLTELKDLRRILQGEQSLLIADDARVQIWLADPRLHNEPLRQRLHNLEAADFRRRSSFEDRQKMQKEALQLPLLPTTTIGSFPQTAEIRRQRRAFKRGEIDLAQYESYLKQEIASCIRVQEELGLDVLVHGEAERNDMVEYFGEQLDGFAFSANAWVQSYGSRCVKPPIIYGDVTRPQAMTVSWSRYAQSLSDKPVKGMLTGPVTILQWSFVRADLSRAQVTRQIALAIREEVCDLEAGGIKIIQIDEPAIREGLPLRKSAQQAYLQWAVDAFRLSASGVNDATQIHTHMCYSEFNEIIDSVAALDADVISIEASRSKMELLEAFRRFEYPNEIGPGVYDIHSPRIPSTEEMHHLIELIAAKVPLERVWINPDCGLKTRAWEETSAALRNMVAAAKAAREQWLTCSAK